MLGSVWEVTLTFSPSCGAHFSQADMNLFRKRLITLSSMGAALKLMKEINYQFTVTLHNTHSNSQYITYMLTYSYIKCYKLHNRIKL